jgi:3'(2'), 5'-bisphosphate nucleotidase
LRIDSQAKYGVVACGQASLYLRLPSPKTPNYREKIWDHAAGSILIQEAGGKVTDVHGNSLDFTCGAELIANRGVIVSNAVHHEAVLTALQQQIG